MIAAVTDAIPAFSIGTRTRSTATKGSCERGRTEDQDQAQQTPNRCAEYVDTMLGGLINWGFAMDNPGLRSAHDDCLTDSLASMEPFALWLRQGHR
jgi:hypothetical protein